MIFKVLLAFVLVLEGAFAAEWSYSGPHGPSHWKVSSPACGQNQQSPINIYEGDVRADTVSEQFVFNNYDNSNGVLMNLKNNGHTAVVDLSGTTVITVTGGGLPDGSFRAFQFHFHWGSESGTGSEHFISSSPYPMEVHIVHYNTKYPNISVAVNQTDGLAVLGFMFEVSISNNNNYNEIVENLKDVTNPGQSKAITSVPLDSLLPQTFENFYRYSGSLTTPSCQESVTWTIFREPIKISESQLGKFRFLQDSHNHPLVNNYRPVQELNARVVTANFNPDIHWGYSHGHLDAQHWDRYYSNCGLESQSPIDIQSVPSKMDLRIPNLNFHNFSSTSGVVMTLKNNGHTAQVDITGGDISISGGRLLESYQTAQFHLHWGSSDMKGSEHTIDSHAYPMEIHFVHFKKSLRRLSDAVVRPQGLAVLGVLFEISSSDNPALKPIIDNLPSIQNPSTNITIPGFALNSILPENTEDFFSYEGSLTTPRCYQTVIWTVFKDTIKISSSQLEAFRALKSSEKDESGNKLPMVDNFRPVQKLNSRIVLRNFPVITPPASHHWSYHGEHGHSHWYKEYPMCADTPTSRQSPINIEPKVVQFKKIGELDLSSYKSAAGITMEIKNNGHTAQIDITGKDILISGGGLDGIYKAAQLHFHWGSDNRRGSEHLINNKAYPVEIHIVHYNTIYSNILTASANSNGLAVLGFMFEVTKETNPAYEPIVNKLSEIKKPKTKASIQAFPLASILPRDLSQFYRYQGGLTTPACNETVTWTVFRDAIQISQEQVNTFRTLMSSDKDPGTNNYLPLVNNYRPPQKLNNRKVHANFMIAIGDSSTTLASNFVLIWVLWVLARILY